MNDNDRKRWAELMIEASEYFDKDVSAARMRLYFEDLRSYPIEAVADAMQRHRRVSKFFPQIADIVELIEGGMTDRVAVAWAEVRRLSSNSETARSQDPNVEQAVAALGGWIAIGRADEFGMRQLSKEFERMYAVNAKRSLVGMLSAQQRGLQRKRRSNERGE
jgi:hypothetical protein